jgi:hypothetical protein
MSDAVREYPRMMNHNLNDMRCELKDILTNADDGMKETVKEMLDIMHRYDVAPFDYDELMKN